MSGVSSCRQCGCSEIDIDPSRGDAVCTNCGFVLEESIIVSEVTFEEDGHGGASAVGQFVSAESRGGGGMGVTTGNFHSGVGKESREITLRSAKKKIVEVAQQLRLNQHCIDVAFNFFKMALHKQLTKGRKNSLTIAACVYMTCRIEGTPHLLIDFSDVVQMDVYALGRAFVQISRSLFINIPAVDPCMYILRFAHKFELGDKTHEVAMTALRLVQRMKRDWIHLGRRPSGLCGAALLIAGRLHGFSRSVQDVISVVKVHETTLRKRLVEFGETPSSSLTLDEFMSVDLEEEHDPPSFKAARLKDRERLQKLLDDEVNAEFLDIQKKIEEELDKRRKKVLNRSSEDLVGFEQREVEEGLETNRFILESTITTINHIILEPSEKNGSKDGEVRSKSPSPNVSNLCQVMLAPSNENCDMDRILMPPPPSNAISTPDCSETGSEIEKSKSEGQLVSQVQDIDDSGELDLEGIDDSEIEGYIMDVHEVRRKTAMWEDLNAEYIEAQKQKQIQLEKDRLEGKPEKKKRKKGGKNHPTFQAKSANEAIKIMLLERKMSNKINYDVLRTLTSLNKDMTPGSVSSALEDGSSLAIAASSSSTTANQEPITVIESGPIVPNRGQKRLALKEEGADAPTQQSKKYKSKKPKVEQETKAKIVTEVRDTKKSDIVHVTEQEVIETVEESGVVVECGPVHYADDYNDTDDEEETFSTGRLLTQFRGEEEPSYDDYYE